MFAQSVKKFLQSPSVLRHFLVYALPCLFIWSFYFLSFYPGMMSADSLNQWKPIVTLEFNDWHPASLSFLYWLLTRIWFSPAIICIAQMLGLAAVLAYGLVKLEQKGLSARALALLVLFFSLFPLNGFYVNTLFKDIPFSIAYLLIFIYLLAILDSRGIWLQKSKNIFWLALALSFICIIRHNGILTAVPTLFVLLYFYPQYFKKIGLLAILSIALVFVVKVPLYKALKVQGRFFGIEMIMTHQLGAILSSGAKLKPDEKALLQKVLPLNVWEKKYYAYLIDPLIFNKHFKNYYSFFEEPANKQKFEKVWFNLARRNVWILIKHQLRVTDLVWNPGMQKNSYCYTVHTQIDQNNLGLSMQSFLPKLKNKLINYHKLVYQQSVLRAIFLRPAIYIYAGFMLLFLIYRNTRQKEIAVLALPLVTLVVGVFLTIPAQHVRYLYPCFLLTPFLAAYLQIKLQNQRLAERKFIKETALSNPVPLLLSTASFIR